MPPRSYGLCSYAVPVPFAPEMPVPVQTDTLFALSHEGLSRSIQTNLQVIIDILYQHAIMVSLSRHDSSACPPWPRRIADSDPVGSGVPIKPCLPILPSLP